MKSLTLAMLISVSTLAISAEMPAPKDGTYTLTITHAAHHPEVQFPSAPIPEEAYKPQQNKNFLTMRITEKGKAMTILAEKDISQKDIIFKLKSATEDERIYDVTKPGLGYMFQMKLKQTKQELTGTLTEFGSGEPVLWSMQGLVSEKKAVGK